MRIVVTGAEGQLGRSLQRALKGLDLFLIDLPEHDVTERRIAGTIAEFQPDLVVHAAAMTDVEGCELDPDSAFKVNALGTRNVADATIDLWVMNADGASQRRIYDSGSAFLEGIAWHPDGEIIYLSRGYFDGAGNVGLKVMALSASGPDTQSGIAVERLWDRHFSYSYAAVTADGGRVVFAHYEGYAMP